MDHRGVRVFELLKRAKSSVENDVSWESFLEQLFNEAESGNYKFLETITEPGVLPYVKEAYESWDGQRKKARSEEEHKQLIEGIESLHASRKR